MPELISKLCLCPAKCSEINTKASAIGGAVYSALVCIFFLTGLIPAFFLNVYLRKRIVRLENGLGEVHRSPALMSDAADSGLVFTGTSTLYQTSSILQQPKIDILKNLDYDAPDRDVEVLGDGPRGRQLSMLELPKDRPFANLTSTSMLPMTYASIFKAQDEPKEKARKLREALRRDNLQLIAYFLMLASMGGLAFFQAAKGELLGLHVSLCHLDCSDLFVAFRSCYLGHHKSVPFLVKLADVELHSSCHSPSSCLIV